MHAPRDRSKEIFSSFDLTVICSLMCSGVDWLSTKFCSLSASLVRNFSWSLHFFAFVLVKVIVKDLISILTISQRSPLSSRSLYLSINCGIFLPKWLYNHYLLKKEELNFQKPGPLGCRTFFSISMHTDEWSQCGAKFISHLRARDCCRSCSQHLSFFHFSY